jgi:predicted signal transduction protein with EAL and GGDEF domain
VADRLRSTTRPTDTVARIGGDEFVILQTGFRDASDTQALARRIVDLIGRTYMVEGHLLTIGASVGVALAPADGIDGDRLLKNADLALYRAKLDGRGTFRFFEPEMDARMQARRQLELDMRQALARREFQLHYQPQLNLETNRLTGCEALIRWRHPQRGMISPLDFIPLAEEIGLPRCRELARPPVGRRERVAGPVQERAPRRDDPVGALDLRTAGPAPGGGDHGGRAASGEREDAPDAVPPARARRAGVDG